MLPFVQIESAPSVGPWQPEASKASLPLPSHKASLDAGIGRLDADQAPSVADDAPAIERVETVERSRPAARSPPPSPPPEDAFRDDLGNVGVEVLQSIWHPRKNKYRLAGAALANFTNGLHDSAAGALLPYMERHYHVGYGLVSLIFVSTAVGSILAAVLVDGLKRRLGRARTLLLAELLIAVAYVPLLTTTAPFAAVNVGFFLVGLGVSINIAIGNTFCATLQQSGAGLGVMHGAYGIGGISGPLIATAVVVRLGGEAGAAAGTPGSSGPPDVSASAATFFSRYYFLPLGLCVFTAVFCAWSFAGYERDTVSDDDFGTAPAAHGSPSQTAAAATAASRAASASQIPLRDLAASGPPSPSPFPSPSPYPSEFEPSPFFASGSASAGPSGPPAFPQSARLKEEEQEDVAIVVASVRDEESHPSTRCATPTTANAGAVATASAPPLSPPASVVASARHYQRRLHDAFTAPSARIVLLGSLFLCLYQGTEVSIAGWVASFLLADRGAQTSVVGSITAGFWAGITLGRFLLAAVPLRRVGGAWLTPRRFVYGCVAGAAVFELLVWFVPNVVGDAVAVAVVGLLLGPVYPTAAGLLMRGLSRRERVAGVSVMAAFGSAGGAAAPFVTGMIAQAAGPFVLHPVVIVLCAGMLVIWYLVPAEPKPTE